MEKGDYQGLLGNTEGLDTGAL